jgi:hypothetical protein
MYGVQAHYPLFPQEQKNIERTAGTQEILPFLPQAHAAQRNEIDICHPGVKR